MSLYQVMPALSDDEFATLKADIAARGVLIPVEYDEDGNILDGHHRVQICDELGISDFPKFIRKGLTEAEKRTHARNLNIARRHLNREQRRELIAADLKDDPSRSNRQVASGLGVSHHTVQSVRDQAEATGQIAQLEKTTGADGKERRKPIRTAFVDPTPEGAREALDRAKEVRSAKQAEKRHARDEKLTELSNANAPLPSDRRYPVIYADPPWQYDFSPSSGRAVENHYPTMPIEDILAMPVADLATPDAVLFLWAPPSFIKKGIATIEAWGFELASSMVWDKEVIGTGIYFRQQHEYLLLGKRGKPITPAPGAQPRSVVRSRREGHSEKPAQFYEIIEAMYPGLPKIELFSRGSPEGWAAWGNQAHGG